MAPRFYQHSFSFEKGEEIPKHIEEYPGGERDGSLWHIDGYDTFEGAVYPLASDIECLGVAELLTKAARRSIEQTQPTSSSGGLGFGGIQDRVYVIHPRTRT